MALRYYANAPATTLAASCTSLATSIEVTATTGFPVSYPYTLIIDRGLSTEEAVSVTNASGTTLTVTRGIDSTTAFAHTNGASVVHGITAQDVREPNSHVNASSAVHGLTGSVVGTTDTQALTNKDLTAGTNSFPTSLVTLTDTQTLTNKTLALGSNTVSGTKAQFNTAVTDGNPVWDNEIGLWSAYTPVWTGATSNPVIGNGTLAGRWSSIGKTINVYLDLTAGSTTTFGSGPYRFSLPIASRVTALHLLQGTFYMEGGIAYVGFPRIVTSTTFEIVYHSVSTPGALENSAGPTLPFTWGNGHFARGYFSYEAA